MQSTVLLQKNYASGSVSNSLHIVYFYRIFLAQEKEDRQREVKGERKDEKCFMSLFITCDGQ